MNAFAKLAFGALVLGGAALAGTAPAAARTDFGISFGFGYPAYGYPSYGYGYANPCAYYDYDDYGPPPWGVPPGYCGYPVYYGPVYWGGYWHRGPIHYRWDGGRRVYWLNGGWRHDEWRGRPPGHIEWRDRGSGHWQGGGRWQGGSGHWQGGHRR